MAFSLLASTVGEGLMILHLHFFFFLKWRSASVLQFDCLGEDQSTVAKCSLTSCV